MPTLLHHLVRWLDESPKRRNRSFQPQLESLEARCLLAPNVFVFDNNAGTNLLSDFGNWKENGMRSVLDFPGSGGRTDDIVNLSTPNVGQLTVDAKVTIGQFNITNFNNTIAVNANLIVKNGKFQLTDTNPDLVQLNNADLTLQDIGAGNASWTSGSIGSVVGKTGNFNILGSQLNVSQAPAYLTGSMVIQQDGTTPASVTLAAMTQNLTLSNVGQIDVKTGGTLNLNQNIADNTQRNARGGLVFSQAHAANVASVIVESGGTLNRNDGAPTAGIPDEVRVDGFVSNAGTVSISSGNYLNIYGQDANGNAYVQNGNQLTSLSVGTNAELWAGVRNIEIDTGQVTLGTLANPTVDAISANAITFKAGNTTSLGLVDGAAPGTVLIAGDLNLSADSVVDENFTGGATPAADLIKVVGGKATLAGTLTLISNNGQAPPAGRPLTFIEDQDPGVNNPMTGRFASISDDLGNNLVNNQFIDNSNQQDTLFTVTW